MCFRMGKINPPLEVTNWIANGVDVNPMFKHFKVNFRGNCYDSDHSEPIYFPNVRIMSNL